ncbi:MAG: uroporphyrinogen decarboxylase family protein [Anaerolineaceae bacterium]
MNSKISIFAKGNLRFQEALRGVPGRVPMYAQMHEYAAAHAGISPLDFYTHADLMVPALLEVQSSLGIDVVSLTYDIYNIEAEALGQSLSFTESGIPDIDRSHPLIRGYKDLDRIHTPDFNRDGRFKNVIKMMRNFEDQTGNPPVLGFCAPFTLAANLRGVGPLLMDLYEAPDFAHTLFELLTEKVLAPWIHYQQNCLPSASRISGADAMASIPIINPTILHEWVVPWTEHLRKLCGPQVSVANWVGESHLKNPSKMLDLKLKVGPGSILGQDPDVDMLSPGFYRDYAEQHGLPLILGIGAAFLAEAQPKQIIDRIVRYIQEGRPSTGFALYLCNVGPTTPRENIEAAVWAAHNE